MRYSLRTILLYTSVVAMVLTIRLAYVAVFCATFPVFARDIRQFAFLFGLTANSLVVALSLLGGFCVLSVGRAVAPREPGHWILLVSAVSSILSLFIDIAMTTHLPNSWSAFEFALLLRTTVEQMAFAVGLSVGLIRGLAGLWWKAFFVYYCAWAVALLVVITLTYFGRPVLPLRVFLTTTDIVSFALVVAATSSDLRHRRYRDALHWVGVAYLVARYGEDLSLALLDRWT